MTIKSVKSFFCKDKANSKPFRWSSISSGNQKKIIKKAVLGSNRLQRDLYNKAKSV